MKLLICIFLVLTTGWLHAQDGFHALSIITSSGRVVNMSEYKGKKTLIVVASPAALQAKSSARYLGDIQQKYPDVSVVVIPVADSAASIPTDKLKAIANTDHSALVTTAESSRHPLLQWLSDSKQNRHFDVTLKNEEQFFVISASGVLYAVLEKGVSDGVLKEVLTAKDVQPQQVITDINRQGHNPPR